MCFSLVWLENLLIWLVVIGAIVALVRLVLPRVLGPLNAAVDIVLWAVVAVFAIIVVFDLLACLVGFPRLTGMRG